MKVAKLTLQDFRGFARLELDFADDVTVLVGVNGAGKTTILDAIAILFRCLHMGIVTGKLHSAKMIADNDVRAENNGNANIELTAEIAGTTVSWTLGRNLPGYPDANYTNLVGLREPIAAFQDAIAKGAALLPLAVYFPTNRNALDIPDRIRKPHQFSALDAYAGAVDAGERNFRSFFEWFRDEEDVYNQQVVEQSSTESSPVPIVRDAIKRLLPGVDHVRIERRPQRMTLISNGVHLDVAQLSDGEKTLLALAGDLARRMVLAAPALPNPLTHAAVVLIDEIELHLHPGLQRQIIPRLRSVFPNAQFIVSTHSPQVLSSVHARSVRVVDQFRLRTATHGTWQRDTNRILETAFSDPGRPPDVAEKLDALRDAVDHDAVSVARKLIRELRALTEGEDADVTFYEQLLPPESVDGEAL